MRPRTAAARASGVAISLSALGYQSIANGPLEPGIRPAVDRWHLPDCEVSDGKLAPSA
jgi:hypothetical protein